MNLEVILHLAMCTQEQVISEFLVYICKYSHMIFQIVMIGRQTALPFMNSQAIIQTITLTFFIGVTLVYLPHGIGKKDITFGQSADRQAQLYQPSAMILHVFIVLNNLAK